MGKLLMKIKGIVLVACLFLFWTVDAFAAGKLDTEKKKFSYTIGVQMASGVKRQGVDLDVDAFKQAVDDVMSGHEPELTMEEMQTVLNNYQQREMARMNEKAEENRKSGQAFLEKNGKDKMVTVLKSGIQYKITQAGKGKKPKASDTVVVNYRGTLIDGTEFDSSYKRGQPATFPVNGVIKGWQEVLQLMPTGSKWHVVIPSDLAYGPRGTGGPIGPNATLVFDIELIDIK